MENREGKFNMDDYLHVITTFERMDDRRAEMTKNRLIKSLIDELPVPLRVEVVVRFINLALDSTKENTS